MRPSRSAGRLSGVVALCLPMVAPVLVFAGAVVYGLTLGEIAATLLLIPPGVSTLGLRLYDALHMGNTGSAALAAVFMAALLVIPAALGAAWALRRARSAPGAVPGA